MRDSLCRDLTGTFVGCDGEPTRATCSFHDRPCVLAAGDLLQLEVERMNGEWTPLFHRCADHAVETFPDEHTVHGTAQALVTARLEPTGAHLPTTGRYDPEALTIGDVEVLDVSRATEGRRSPLADTDRLPERDER
ncbi:hypothetical protein [Halomarina rubra]|uniref:Uncharacterized protein n=1 Tax=Halomarina rubra TaxID=2071873 RepID=A0ABD6B0Y5_9EURY|nr:hypothetical protein [Halomarina rubra]